MNTMCKKSSLFFVLVSLLLSAHLSADEGSSMVLKTEAGRSFQVYAAGPNDARRGILLVHGWWGLNDQARSWAD